jgi:hypothetical protein
MSNRDAGHSGPNPSDARSAFSFMRYLSTVLRLSQLSLCLDHIYIMIGCGFRDVGGAIGGGAQITIRT